jgi:DNA-binding transcriptional LysR family regulator
MGQIKEFPDIHFKIDILPNEAIIKGLLEAQFDFGFVIGERITPELRFQKFSDEPYSAVSANKEMLRPLQDPERIEELRLVTYPGWETSFATWSKAHGLWKAIKRRSNAPTVHVGTLAGAIHAIQEGAGVGVVPTQCVMQDLESQRLHEWKHSKTTQATNPVYIARRIGEKLPKRVELVMEMLKQAKAELG